MDNKIKFNFTNNVQTISNQTFEEVSYSGNRWVNYGKDNLYPEFLWSLYLNSSTHSAIIDGKVDYIVGEGLVSGDKQKLKLLKRITFDHQLYGGFALQLVYNSINEISKVIPLDFSRCRVNKDLTKVYYSNKWTRNGGKPVEYDIYDPTNDKPKTTEIYYFRGDKTRSIYPIPSYIGGTQSIETSIEIQNFHLNAIRNNFAVSAIINMVGDPTDDEREQFSTNLRENFTGTNESSNFLTMWNETKEDAVTITRLETDKADEKFERLSKDVKENIFISHRVVSGALFGLVSESTGFNSTEYQESFKLFNKTVILPTQNLLIDCLTEIYGVEEEIIPFKIELTPTNNNLTYELKPLKNV